MQLPHDQAYANAPVFPVGPMRKRGIVGWVADWIIDCIAARLYQRRATQAIDSFRYGAMIGKGLSVGVLARCVNMGPKNCMVIGEDVICRGVLRCENLKEAKLSIGDRVYIGENSIISCHERIEICTGVNIAHGVHIFDNDSHPLDATLREMDMDVILGKRPGPRPVVESAPVCIGERAWIGMNAIILKGVKIGEGAGVGPGAVVTGDVPPYTIVLGNPARAVIRLQQGSNLKRPLIAQ